MDDIIIVLIVLVVIFISSLYIIREKKKGKKCIGCPYSGQCQGSCKGKIESDIKQ